MNRTLFAVAALASAALAFTRSVADDEPPDPVVAALVAEDVPIGGERTLNEVAEDAMLEANGEGEPASEPVDTAG